MIAHKHPPHPPLQGAAHAALDGEFAQSTAVLEAFLARDPAFRGIGTVRARKLAARFGDGLHAALKDHDARVAEILGEDLAEALFATYQNKLDEASVAAFLSELRVSPSLALKIQRVWGTSALDHLRRNPFLLVGWIGWQGVESIARRLGVADDDPRRLVAAVETALYRRLDQKHTTTPRIVLIQDVARLVGRANAAKALDFAIQDHGAEAFEDSVQAPGAAAMERFVATKIAALCERPPQRDLVASEIEPVALARAIDDYETGQPHRLTREQRNAMHMGLTQGVACLGGYAGSGKTTILKALCACGERFGRTFEVMAVSGRAARRVTELTGRRAKTIAYFIKQMEDPSRRLGPECVVVIDEASMVDLATLYQVMRRMGDASLIMVGDPGQLPPIGFGLTFHAMIDAVPTMILDRVHRQSASSGIPAVAEEIRMGQPPQLPRFSGLGAGVAFEPCAPEEALVRIEAIGRALKLAGACRGEAQIIAPIRAGPAGICAINAHFHALRGRAREHLPGRPDIAVGDPIVWRQNDYDRDLQNGTLGRVVGVDAHARVGFVEFGGREFTLTAADREKIDLAYAISVHKAQGSQWERVIVPVFGSRVLDRTLLYTAVTRAISQVILVGDAEAFERAVRERPASRRRQTALAQRLAGTLHSPSH